MAGKSKKQILLYAAVIVNILLLTINGFLLSKNNSSVGYSKQYPYLSKRIFTENQNDILINFTPLRQAMRDYVSKQNDKIGVYFEYLPSGTSIGVNDQMEVRIASLIKIPIVIAAYKKIEEGKLDLNKSMTIDQDDLDQSFGQLWQRGAGAKLTVDKAVNLMLVESDNTAARVLTDELPEFAIESVFDSLDIPKEREDSIAVISPKSYTSILRSLYLSSSLSRDNSNRILEILTKTNFTDKLPAGVPEEVKVAHKIGIHDQNSEHPVYSDCGIVYIPNRPYSLCIMTKDVDENTSRQHIRLLSKMVYGYVASVR